MYLQNLFHLPIVETSICDWRKEQKELSIKGLMKLGSHTDKGHTWYWQRISSQWQRTKNGKLHRKIFFKHCFQFFIANLKKNSVIYLIPTFQFKNYKVSVCTIQERFGNTRHPYMAVINMKQGSNFSFPSYLAHDSVLVILPVSKPLYLI
jgi:hypothetical protein